MGCGTLGGWEDQHDDLLGGLQATDHLLAHIAIVVCQGQDDVCVGVAWDRQGETDQGEVAMGQTAGVSM